VVRRIRANWIWLLLLVLLFAVVLELARSDPAEQVVVPSLVDLSEAEARRRLATEGLLAVVARRVSAGPRGRVLDQDPEAGTPLGDAKTVLLVVSAASPTVPRLIGLALPAAASRLRAAGLELGFRAVNSNLTAGLVVATDPASGEPVAAGAKVTVSVSRGPGRIAVPSLLWSGVAEAGARVRKAGLVARAFEVPSAEPAGTVVAQSPQPGAELARGSRIRLDVSTGTARADEPARTVGVPGVVGTGLTAAQDRLEAVGLVVRVEYETTAKAPPGRVLKQDPPPATRIRRGSNVRIAVSAGPEPSDLLEVLELVGLLQDAATSASETAGFRPRVLPESTPDPAEVGVVVRQEPEAFRRAPQSGQITIYVGAAAG